MLTAPRPTRRLRAIRTALVIHPSGQEEDRHELRQDAHPHVEGSCHSSVLRSGGRRTALYEMSKPPDPLTATEEELRADLSQVLSALERVSLVSEMEDHLRRVYFRRVRITALVALAIMIGTTAMAATYQEPRWVPTMGIVLLAGIVGACFSAQQRAQTAIREVDRAARRATGPGAHRSRRSRCGCRRRRGAPRPPRVRPGARQRGMAQRWPR